MIVQTRSEDRRCVPNATLGRTEAVWSKHSHVPHSSTLDLSTKNDFYEHTIVLTREGILHLLRRYRCS